MMGSAAVLLGSALSAMLAAALTTGKRDESAPEGGEG